MKLSQLETLQKSNVRPVIQQTVQLLEPYRGKRVSPNLWLSLMLLLFGVVYPASKRSGEIARRFYDEERERVFPGIPRHDFFLPELQFEKFLEDMDEAYELFRNGEAPNHAPHSAGLRAARTIENTGRLTVIKAMSEEDPYLDFEWDDDSELVVEGGEPERAYEKGRKDRLWARVATGAETCGWCIMLCSRGAVYASSEAAGELRQWHTGCDCKVVPVFDKNNWEGRDRWKAAEQMWIEATKDGTSGNDAINAMRRAAGKGRFKEILNS